MIFGISLSETGVMVSLVLPATFCNCSYNSVYHTLSTCSLALDGNVTITQTLGKLLTASLSS